MGSRRRRKALLRLLASPLSLEKLPTRARAAVGGERGHDESVWPGRETVCMWQRESRRGRGERHEEDL